MWNTEENLAFFLVSLANSYGITLDKKDAYSGFEFRDGTMETPSGVWAAREDGRVVTGSPPILLGMFYGMDGPVVYPNGGDGGLFYICWDSGSVGEDQDAYLYYLTDDYWDDVLSGWESETGTGVDSVSGTLFDGSSETDVGTDTDIVDTDTDMGTDTDIVDTDTDIGTDTDVIDTDVDMNTDVIDTDLGGGINTDIDDGGVNTDVIDIIDTDVGGPDVTDDGPAQTVEEPGVETPPPADAPPEDAPPEDAPPVETPPDAVDPESPPQDALITEAPLVRRHLNRIQRVRLHKRESSVGGPFVRVLRDECVLVNIELVGDDDTCSGPSCESCETTCTGAPCEDNASCPPETCVTLCPDKKCSEVCETSSCADNALCPPPSCTTKCPDDDCFTIWGTTTCDSRALCPAPSWTVLCPDKCLKVCQGCSSDGCVPQCSTTCPSPCSGTTCPCTGTTCPCTGPNCPCTGTKCGRCTGTNCGKCTTCDKTIIYRGCPLCVYTFTDFVFTCPSATTITISTCTQNKCAAKTMSFSLGTHTIGGTAVIPIKSSFSLILRATASGRSTSATGTRSSTSSGNDASQNGLVGTFLGALALCLLVW